MITYKKKGLREKSLRKIVFVIGSRGYTFKNDLLVTFENVYVPNWHEDVLVFGIETNKYDATILRAYSATQNKNVLIEIVGSLICSNVLLWLGLSINFHTSYLYSMRELS
jgi:hypothetical protein